MPAGCQRWKQAEGAQAVSVVARRFWILRASGPPVAAALVALVDVMFSAHGSPVPATPASSAHAARLSDLYTSLDIEAAYHAALKPPHAPDVVRNAPSAVQDSEAVTQAV